MAELEPLHYEEISGRARDGPLLVLLHGRGANENDLPPIVDFVARGWNAVSVRAPFEFSMGGYAWYKDLEMAGPEPPSLRNALGRLERTLADVREGFPDSRIVFLGFSQGALIALCASTSRPKGLVGAAALSGYLPKDELLPAPLSRLHAFPVFQSHAPNDFILPFAWAEATRDRLVKAGADLTWIEHEAGHTIPLDAMERLSTWLVRVAGR